MTRYTSLIVNSGRGLHGYWLFDQFLARTPENAGLIDRFLETFKQKSKSNPWKYNVDSVWDLARILRVPGTLNRKDPANPLHVHLCVWNGSQVVPLEGAYSVPRYTRDELFSTVEKKHQFQENNFQETTRVMLPEVEEYVPPTYEHQEHPYPAQDWEIEYAKLPSLNLDQEFYKYVSDDERQMAEQSNEFEVFKKMMEDLYNEAEYLPDRGEPLLQDGLTPTEVTPYMPIPQQNQMPVNPSAMIPQAVVPSPSQIPSSTETTVILRPVHLHQRRRLYLIRMPDLIKKRFIDYIRRMIDLD